ncbi:hypothetical protein [Neobacillus cucumis]|uniref:hypothetical protein n=1 Tax=Neobacillus cucumis TaxID=1740721 RepID=UPI002E1CF885|nr:hypothetical protein [Neobacillus cucumis]
MDNTQAVTKKEEEDIKKFSEVNEFNHENNPVAKAQKQMSSQETTGVLDQE